jgi:predicted lipoprotein with Yx(FWY)xxD motif
MRNTVLPKVYRWLAELIPALLITAIFLSACQGSVEQAAPKPAVPAAATAAPLPNTGATPTVQAAQPATIAPVAAGEPTISIASDPKLGKFLVGDNGMTLYMYTKDTAGKSNCNPECLKKWPALLTKDGKPTLGEGVDASLVGTAAMADGSKIVTYNGMPLYYWTKDKKAGDTTGEGVGSVWFVVTPDGKIVNEDGTTKPGFGMGGAAAGAPAATSAPAATQPPASPAATQAPAASMAAPAAGEPEINIATDPKLGKLLVGDKGMTLYMFTKDEPNKSNCDAACMNKWPPLLTKSGKPTLGTGVDAKLIGTATLADGSKMVTYNGMPLYYWYKDAKPGDTTGEAVGEVWYVVSPDGKLVEEDGTMKTPGAAGEQPAASAAAAPAAAPAAKGPALNVATNPKLGKFLVGDNGMTLYIFKKDAPGKSNCNADCLAKWPPLLAGAAGAVPVLGEGIDPKLIGTATLADGRTIITYNGMPLYYWSKDAKPGDVTGQGVGGVWFVVSPAGTVINVAPSSSNTNTTKEKGGGYGPNY